MIYALAATGCTVAIVFFVAGIFVGIDMATIALRKNIGLVR